MHCTRFRQRSRISRTLQCFVELAHAEIRDCRLKAALEKATSLAPQKLDPRMKWNSSKSILQAEIRAEDKSDVHAKAKSACASACLTAPCLRVGLLLVVRLVEEVVGRIWYQLRLTDRASRCRSSTSASVQPLHEPGLGQQISPGGPFLIADRLQQQAGNRTCVRATGWIRAGVDRSHSFRPHLAGIEGTLPCRVAAQGHRDAGLGIGIDAGEVSNDLNGRFEQICKQCRF